MLEEIPEGGDITFSHMIDEEENLHSEVAEFYENSTVFLTGATGYVGKLMLEKLLRTVRNIKVYALVRPKKGKEIHRRSEELFAEPIFEVLRRKRPHFAANVVLIEGDISLPDVGLSAKDKDLLVDEVTCILHCAATVRFDEKMRAAAHTNVRAVRDILRMAKQMKQLKAMMYVSTAFSNCIRPDIDEKFYDPPITGEKLLSLVECLDEEKLTQITPILLGDYPNSYVFTKAVAESVVREEGKNLPVCVVRPSIILATVKEPVSGFIDNFYGATGILLGAALGLIRSCHGRKENLADMVPADYVVNSALAAAWDVAHMKTLNPNEQDSKVELEDIPIYNYVCGPERPITWQMFADLSYKHCTQIPTEMAVWHYCFAMRPNPISHYLAILFLHTLPAYIIDFLAICVGKKPLLVKGYQKINKFSEVISYFAMRQWDFRNKNTQQLWAKLKAGDRKLFDFSMKGLCWDAYWHTYVRGARVYLVKDPLDTIPKGRVKYYKLMVAHYAMCTFLLFVAYKLLAFVFNLVV